ncbi:hypothetical protein D0U00_15080 [Leclercia adecarboxylata]|nr:hypothetical protein D0U00_15080 [Leclercia adecarboxylata]
MKSKHTTHRNTNKKGKGKSRKKACSKSVQNLDTVEKCTKYMRFFYWLFRLYQLFFGSDSDSLGSKSLFLYLKEVLNALIKKT